MSMVCPQCRGAYDQRLNCPQCGLRLQFQAPCGKSIPTDEDGDEWQQTPWQRLVVGVLLAQGMYYVLRHLLTAGILVTLDRQTSDIWTTLAGLVIIQSFQAVGVISAGLLSGAGQRRGFLYGALVGVWNGILFALGHQFLGQHVNALALFGEPLIQGACGALGGVMGSVIWRPLPSLAPLPELSPSLPNVPRQSSFSRFSLPLSWGRVLVGITVSVGGVVCADTIREFVLEASDGKLRIDTQLQADLVTWEIAALSMISGAALAGANTFNGLKQGLAVGIGSGAILFTIRLNNINMTAHLLVLTLVSALCLGVAGGWFGAQLLPPIISMPSRRRRRLA